MKYKQNGQSHTRSPEQDWDYNPVDYFNIFCSWDDCFKGVKLFTWITDYDISVTADPTVATFTIEGEYLTAHSEAYNITPGKKYTKFMTYTLVQFKGNYQSAIAHVEYTIMGKQIPFVRVGTDYFKVFSKTDRYGVQRKIIKSWRKDEIKQDCGAQVLHHIVKFDDFCIEPDNLHYSPIVNKCYNLYSEFSHQPHCKKVLDKEIPTSLSLVRHIFGDQFQMGLTYLKVLYEMPKQVLPVLCLVSSERQTGKTTFVNWMNMIFGDNFILINPEDLSSNFNSSYATKNVISIDETVIDKISSVEKLKALATQKHISVNQKHVSHYTIPFFAKVIICTNKEKDFMKIDEEEIRFWVRKVRTIKRINTNIENELASEIPKFLKYLLQLPKVDTSRSRMVFTPDELSNDDLTVVKLESHSSLRKELDILISEHFNSDASMTEFKATAKDLKEAWFARNHTISSNYIHKVLKDEMRLAPSRMTRYSPLGGDPMITKPGTPFTFKRINFNTEPVNLQPEFVNG